MANYIADKGLLQLRAMFSTNLSTGCVDNHESLKYLLRIK